MTVDTHGAGWTVEHLDLRVELGGDRVVVDCSSHVRWQGAPGATAPLVFDGRGLETLEVAVDGTVLGADGCELADRTLTLALTDDAHVVSTRVAVVPGGPGDKGVAYRPRLISTNCEPEGFRRITWSLDHPSHRPTFDVTLVADPSEFRALLANGDRVDGGELEDGRVWERFVDPISKPTYLFAFVAGDLDLVARPHTTVTGRTVDLRVAALPEQIGGASFALDVLDAAMSFDEANGGIEHDLDALTFVALPGYPDATEYHGLMFFDSSLLVVDQRGSSDDDLLLIMANVAHEYGHHVRGNRVTLSSWGQLALKEGLTVLMGQNDVRRHLFGPVGRVLDVVDLRRLQFPEENTIGAPVVRGEVANPEQLYTRTTYLKGAEVFGMLRTLLGDQAWRQGFAEFVRRYDLASAGVDDFVAVLRETAPARSADIDGVARWFALRGRPSLSLSVATSDGTTVVDITRTDALTDDPPVAMPIVLGFLADDGRPLDVTIDGVVGSEHTVVLTGPSMRVEVASETSPVISPLRGYSAPVDLATDLSAQHLAVLLEHDPDAVAQWWASEELMIRAIDQHRHGAGDDPSGPTVALLADGLRAVLRRGTAEPMQLAQLLALPDEFMLGDREASIDVDGVASGLAVLRSRLGLALHDDLLDLLERTTDDSMGTSPADIATRSLIEPCLALLLATGSDAAIAAAERQLRSPNPTRAIRALAQLVHLDAAPIDDYVAETYERWKAAPKLLDRWLRAQSGSRRADTIERVAALRDGPLYDRNDRGRIMGLWFPFATRNRSVFHDPSGAGYRLFVDEVIELMPINAGVVIRLVGDLLQFKRFDDHRSALMRHELERMAVAPGMPDFAVGIVQSLLA